MRVDELVAKALELDLDERYLLAHQVLDSLPQPDPRIDQLWADEAARRLHAHREGRETRSYSLDEVLGDDD